MSQLTFHRKIVYVFCGLSLLPLLILAFFATHSFNTVEQLLRVSAIEALDEQAAEMLELRAVMVAGEVSAFLKQVESDLTALAQLPTEADRYLWFSQTHLRPIWIRSGTNDAPEELRLTVPLYSEISFVAPNGYEQFRIVDAKLSEQLRDVSEPANTTYLTETYFNSALNLPPGQIYVSHVTGWHVSKQAQLRGAKTPEEAVTGANYKGVIRFARPVHRDDGSVRGVIVLSLDHRHLMEFTQHITPTDKRYVVFPSYQSGNYAFMFDDEGWIVTHPKLWDIRGLDRNGHLIPPYSMSSTPDEIDQGLIPYNLREAAFVHANYPVVHQAVLGGQSGVVDVTNVGGSQKIMAYAPIFYDSGSYAELGVFGGVTIGAEVTQFHQVAEAASVNIKKLYTRFLTGAWVLITLTFIMVVAVAYRLSHNITSPLSRLISGTKQMARGKLAAPVEIDAPAEVAELAAAFNSMSRQLFERRERLLKMLAVLRQSRQDIQQERDFKQTIVENVEVGILTLDEQHNVTSLNGPACKILNLANLESRISLQELLVEWVELRDAVQRASSAEHWSDYVAVERAGRSLTYRLALHPLHSGRSAGHILTIEDLTERVSFRQQMARFERLASLGRLSAGIAHEVRNPLTGISLLLDDLHDRLLNNPADQSLIQRALQEIERLEGLIRELLNFASLPETRLAPGDLVVTLRETLFLVSKQFQKHKIKVLDEAPDTLPHPRMDADRLKQAFLNLFTNALDAMPEGGTLRVLARAVDAGVEVLVEDTGCGIPAERLPLLFEPFYTTKGEGTGLGLSITHTIIVGHGGQVEVESLPDQGTTFRIFLPTSG